ncbi:hypothetical protein [Nocardioides sp. 1609]|uniref:hypothetical protein n=1 Tax=Nocardioides sp. 1609 TaxID=2508327 RepID=UPI00106F5D82|nr:hypothetical protein [Nocardioides sp. 1609]
MKLQPRDYRDPEALITEVAERVTLRAGDVYLVLVAHPSTEQRVDKVVLLDLDAEQEDCEDTREELHRVMQTLPVPDVVPPTHGVMTVVVRPGRTVISAAEAAWLRGWRYANHGRSCYDTDLILVTEHGWTDLMTDWGGALPAMAAP